MQEGCKIKLKMGKEGEAVAEQPEGKTTEQPKEEPEKKKEDVEKLRKVIKVDDKKQEKPSGDADLEPNSREGLEQKRAILQSIKDFDFQIKKNQEEITAVNNKLDAVSKDLDDLVSLYEIVSEQMNPFVGLSKVTKKRLDALENFTKEIDDIKDRMGDIESFAVRAGADLKTMNDQKQDSEKKDKKTKLEKDLKETPKTIETNVSETQRGEIPAEEIKVEKPVESQQTMTSEHMSLEENQTVVMPVNNNITYPETYSQINNNNQNEDYIDIILEKSLNALSIDYKIDRALDEFIESLKA